MRHFRFYHQEQHLAFTRTRPGETKLGETIQAIRQEQKWMDELRRSSARFVLLGIPESIGVQANGGIGGTETAWPAFLSAFLNIQDNQHIRGNSVLLLGQFDFTEEQKKLSGKPIEVLREAVEKIDKRVTEVIQKIVSAGKIPIVIGGGHNNAYGNIKGAAIGLLENGKAKTASINVINLDAHTDFRQLEGRHSGNGFSYAFADGFLSRYAMLGVQENYIPQMIIEEIARNKNLKVISYEDLFVRQPNGWETAMDALLTFTKNSYTGIEVDLDVIENALSSAMSPSGVTVARARQFVHRTAKESKVAYLHICEGAALLGNGQRSATTGKLIAYLVSDFINAV